MRKGMSSREWVRWRTYYRLKNQEEELAHKVEQARAGQGG